MRWLSVMAAKATPEPKRRKAQGLSSAEDPKAAAILMREELARSAKGKIVAAAGFWAATAAIGRNAMQPEADAHKGERCEKTSKRIRIVGTADPVKLAEPAFRFHASQLSGDLRRRE